MKRALVSLLLALAALGFLALAGSRHRPLLAQRGGLTPGAVDPLENSPPLVAFSSVALGGFRGILADLLWLRATRLQDEGRVFELVQLAGWITKLEPRFPAVWAYQAWNLSYNISVLFQDPADKWRWVQHGLRLLRDDGLRYNPGEASLYWELGWIYLHKIGQNLDNDHLYYKHQLAQQMELLLPGGAASLYELRAAPTRPEDLLRDPAVAALVETLRREGIDPLAAGSLSLLAPDLSSRPAGRQLGSFLRRRELEQTARLDLDRLADVEARFGPLDWRMPQSHALYWAAQGLPHAQGFDVVRLDRLIFQALGFAFFEGKAFYDLEGRLVPSPNLALLPRVLDAFDRAVMAHPDLASMKEARRNFMGEAIQVLYVYHRTADARALYERFTTYYPEHLHPRGFEGFAVDLFVGERLQQMSSSDAAAMIEGLCSQSYLWLALGDEERAAGLSALAEQVWAGFMSQVVSEEHGQRIGLAPLPQLRRQGLQQLLDSDLSPAVRTRLEVQARE